MATIPAGDVYEPDKTIPRATVIGTVAAAAVYLLSTTAVFGAVPQKELFTLLCGLQMPLMRLTPAADTLEDVFLRCTADDQALEKK